jgi:hypothetical protein
VSNIEYSGMQGIYTSDEIDNLNGIAKVTLKKEMRTPPLRVSKFPRKHFVTGMPANFPRIFQLLFITAKEEPAKQISWHIATRTITVAT